MLNTFVDPAAPRRADPHVEPGGRGHLLPRAAAADAASRSAGALRPWRVLAVLAALVGAVGVVAPRRRRPGRRAHDAAPRTSGCRRTSSGSRSASGSPWCTRCSTRPVASGRPRRAVAWIAAAGRSPGVCWVAGARRLSWSPRRRWPARPCWHALTPARVADQEPALRRDRRAAGRLRACSPPAQRYSRACRPRVAAPPRAHLLQPVLPPPVRARTSSWWSTGWPIFGGHALAGLAAHAGDQPGRLRADLPASSSGRRCA